MNPRTSVVLAIFTLGISLLWINFHKALNDEANELYRPNWRG